MWGRVLSKRAPCQQPVTLSAARPPPFYAHSGLAEAEATMHYCVADTNGAVRVLHSARDMLLRYLGDMSPGALAEHADVYDGAVGMTGRLVAWYRHAGAARRGS